MTSPRPRCCLAAGLLLATACLPASARGDAANIAADVPKSSHLGVTDAIDRRIAALGLCARRSRAQECAKVHDVQIWSDGGISLRWGEAE